MGNENSKDGEDGEQQEGEEGPSGSEKDPSQSQLPNGDVVRTGDPTPEGEEGDPKESSEVDEHTKRMTIISENVYHYVGVVAGREYARERGLTPTGGDMPVAPIGFMRPKKKKQEDAKVDDGKTASEPGKPPIGKEKLDSEKEAQSPATELPHFYQPPADDKDKAADTSSKTPDVPDGKAKEDVQDKDGKEKVGKLESKPGKEIGSVDTELPRFYQSQETDKEKQATGESGKAADMPSSKVESKTPDKADEQKVEKKDNTPEEDLKLQEMELYQWCINQDVDESGKSEIPALPPGKTGDKMDEKEKKVEKPSKGALESKPEQEVHTPATKIPRFFQPSNEDKKNGKGEMDKSEAKNVSNGTKEGNAKDKPLDKVDKTEAAEVKLPRLYNSPGQDKTKAAGESDKSESQSVSNGDTKTKTDEKNDKLENNSEKEIKMEMPRLYQADGNEDKPDTDPDLSGERYTTALTVGPRSGKTEEPRKRQSVTINFLPAGSRKSEEEDTADELEKEVVEGAVQKDRETSYKKANLGSVESTKEPEVEVFQLKSVQNEKEKPSKGSLERKPEQEVNTPATKIPRFYQPSNDEKANLGSLESTKELEVEVSQSKSAEKKEKIVRFEDDKLENKSEKEIKMEMPRFYKADANEENVVENETPSTQETKRVTSMVYVTPMRDSQRQPQNQEQVWFAAPVELTSTPPPTSADEPRTVGEEDTHEGTHKDTHEGDPVPICGEELRQADKRLKRDSHVDGDYFTKNMAGEHEPVESEKQPQKNDTTTAATVILTLGKDTKTNSEHHDDPDTADDIITPTKAASSLKSSSAVVVLSQNSMPRVHDVEEDAVNYDVHHLKQPVPRSPEVDLGSGKILNAPSILMGSSITMSSNRQKCEVLPQETSDYAVRVKTKPAALKEVRIEPSRIAVRLRNTGGTLSQGDSIDGKRETVTDDVHASVAPLVANTPDSGKNKCDNYTQTSDVARKDERTGGPLVVRSRSVGFQCGAGVGDSKRTIASQKRPSLSSDSRSTKLPETEKKTRIPLVARSVAHHPETKSAQTEVRPAHTPEARRGKGSPLPERKISVLRKDAPTNKSSPRTPPATTTNDSRNHKELAKRISLPVQNSPACSGHPVTGKTMIPASPRLVRKRDDGKGALHKTSASSKSMDSIPRCTCLQVTGKDSPHGDRTVARHLSNPLGLREYGFNPPSKKPHWR